MILIKVVIEFIITQSWSESMYSGLDSWYPEGGALTNLNINVPEKVRHKSYSWESLVLSSIPEP